MRFPNRLGVMLLLCAVAISCGGDGGGDQGEVGGGGTVTESYVVLGEFELGASIVANGCDARIVTDPVQLLVEPDGNDYRVTVRLEDGTCFEHVYVRNGNTLSNERDTGPSTGGSCVLSGTIRDDYTFTSDDDMTGTRDVALTRVSGSCPYTSCTVRIAFTATRCAGCWDGCTRASSVPWILE